MEEQNINKKIMIVYEMKKIETMIIKKIMGLFKQYKWASFAKLNISLILAIK